LQIPSWKIALGFAQEANLTILAALRAAAVIPRRFERRDQQIKENNYGRILGRE
jgi:hypothetical protein